MCVRSFSRDEEEIKERPKKDNESSRNDKTLTEYHLTKTWLFFLT